MFGSKYELLAEEPLIEVRLWSRGNRHDGEYVALLPEKVLAVSAG
jgi:hypothetical protein